ncbi:MAG: HU family DNA-binding protein [Candidatus Azobacteroides sp.]|nr:HU family DNA-binding protein [Candidatus Azobacteroides sp.]
MNEKINIQSLVTLFAEKSGLTKKEAEAFLKEFFTVAHEGLLSDKIMKIKNLGNFKLIVVEDRESIDITNGSRVLIPAHYKVNYSPDAQLAETINEPFSLFEIIEVRHEAGKLEHIRKARVETGAEKPAEAASIEPITEKLTRKEFRDYEENTVQETIDENIIPEPIIEKSIQEYKKEIRIRETDEESLSDEGTIAEFASSSQARPTWETVEEPQEKLSPIDEEQEEQEEQEQAQEIQKKEQEKNQEEIEEQEDLKEEQEQDQEQDQEEEEEEPEEELFFIPEADPYEEFILEQEAQRMRGTEKKLTFSIDEKTPIQEEPLGEEEEVLEEPFDEEEAVDEEEASVEELKEASVEELTVEEPSPAELPPPKTISQKFSEIIENKKETIREDKKTFYEWVVYLSIILIIAGVYLYFEHEERLQAEYVNSFLHQFDDNQEIEQSATTGKTSSEIFFREREPLPRASDTLVDNPIVNNPIAKIDADNSNIIKKRRIVAGERLTLIALKEYGHKSFWVYIYQENRDRIKNPDNVPVGTELIIPPASKYGIDKNSKESIQKADELALQLMSK